ncbi:MAG: hypothetical protein AAF657_00585 [Acidobacteriota bacterium]
MTRELSKGQWLLASLLAVAMLSSPQTAAAEDDGAASDSGAATAATDNAAQPATDGQAGDPGAGEAGEAGAEEGAAGNEKSGATCYDAGSLCAFGSCYPIPTSLRPQGLANPYGAWTSTSNASKCGLRLCFPSIFCQCGNTLLDTTCGF